MYTKKGNMPGLDQRILDELLKCRPDCGEVFHPRHRDMTHDELIDYLVHNLPTLPYVTTQVINFLFSDGLTTGTEDGDAKLDNFLYAENIQGQTNISVLMNAVQESLWYGKNGIRWLSEEDGIINVRSCHYSALTEKNTEYYGFREVIAYIASMDGQKIRETDIKELEFDEEELLRSGVIVDIDKKIIILSKEEFLNLRLEQTDINGHSVLEYDNQRVQMLESIYERLNYDIEYDGPGRIILHLKDGYTNASDNEASTGDIINQTVSNMNDRENHMRKEVAGIAQQIKSSTSDNVIALSNIFENEVEHLPRVTKATEFLEFLTDNEGSIMSQVFGIPPALLALGKISGNISMEKIIDNAMLNSIIPMREKYATQFSSFLAPKLGIPKIYFDKYNMTQSNDENDVRIKVVDMIVKLKGAGYDVLADKFAKILDTDLGNVGKLKTLSINLIDNIKRIIGGRKNERNNDGY